MTGTLIVIILVEEENWLLDIISTEAARWTFNIS